MSETNQNEFERYADLGSEISTLVFEEGGKNLENFEHSGRKGMKWYRHIFGKFQSLAKYAKGSSVSLNKTDQSSSETKEETDPKKMTDEQLRTKINRLRLENDYITEKKKQQPDKKAQKLLFDIAAESGRRFVSAFMQNVGAQLGQAAGKNLVEENKKRK